ncbi:MAG: hypothetical protein QXU20_03335 [Candidatus Woesearchaeota archaeon]
MEAEKRIVNLWLRMNGFFTINDINAGKSVIDILAIKFRNSTIESIFHVEVSCSLGSETTKEENLLKKFESFDVKKKIKSIINNFVGGNFEYSKILVTNSKFSKIENSDVKIINFGDVLKDVLNNLDRQNYQDSVTRTLQLVKFVSLKKSDFFKKIKRSQMIKLFDEFLKTKEAIRFLSEREKISEKLVKRFLRKNPDYVVMLIKKMPKDKRTKFLNALMKKSQLKKEFYEKTLENFFK